jgi:hypothetical protein
LFSHAPLVRHLYACLDNKAATQSPYNPGAAHTSQATSMRIAQLLQEWETRPRPPAFTSCEVLRETLAKLIWIPGHVGIGGNDVADALAKRGASTETAEPLASDAGCRRWARRRLEEDFAEWWERQRSPAHLAERLPAPAPRAPHTLNMRRTHLARLISERSGHGDFASYHERFRHASPANGRRCSCGLDKAPAHFIFCHRTRCKSKLRWWRGRPLPAEDILASDDGARAFEAWLATQEEQDACLA